MVLTALYKKPSTGPPSAVYSIGAITPSEVFSATVSMAAFATPSLVRFWVSLPTIMDTASLAASTFPAFNCFHTFPLSTCRHLAARI